MSAYYNDNDPACCYFLRQLIKAGVIAPGDVDGRPIEEVRVKDLDGYKQVHLFAGGGGWSVAARMAGWPDDRPIMTGSPPCQPFSVAGKKDGGNDPRHLWPYFFRLIKERRPTEIFGEQVAKAAGYAWFDGILHDLRSEGYAVWGMDVAAASVNAPHVRQRIYWVATNGILAHAEGEHGRPSADRNGFEWLENDDGPQPKTRDGLAVLPSHALPEHYWRDSESRLGSEGKFRRVKPGVCLMVDELPGRMDALSIIGNAVVPSLAAQVIAAYLEAEEEKT